MMRHWMRGEDRGLYDQELARPPSQRPPGANDLSARTARLEEHARFGWENTRRIEGESLSRARDISRLLEDHDTRISLIETDRARNQARRETTAKILGGAVKGVRYAMAILLFVGMLSGKMTAEQVNAFLTALGLRGG